MVVHRQREVVIGVVFVVLFVFIHCTPLVSGAAIIDGHFGTVIAL